MKLMNRVSNIHRAAFFKLLLVVIAFNVIVSALSFRISFGIFYYLIFLAVFCILFFISTNEKKHISTATLFILLSCFLSVILNDIPSFFKPYERFFTFCTIIFLVGPFFISQTFYVFRQRTFKIINFSNIILCSLSFLGLSTGIYKGITINHLGAARVDFTGLYNHSMTLGPMSGIAIITCLYYIYLKKNKKIKIIFIFLSILCLLSAITAGSRGALLALVGGVLFFIYKINQGRFVKYFKTILIISTVLIISYPLWEKQTEFLVSKIEKNNEDDQVFDSRTAKWEQRFDEFKSSPLIGIGFASIDVNGQDKYDKENGNIEPGSSWLSILSMTGLLGILSVLFLFYSDFRYILKDKKNKLYTAYLGGILMLMTIHLISEGYIFASGGLLFFYLWMLLGVIEQQKLLK